MVYLITYDLTAPNKDYSGLYQAIKDLAPDKWRHPMESVWCVSVGNGFKANDVYEALKPHVDSDDYLLVVDITQQDRQGWLSKDFWNWLKEQG